MDLNFIRGPFNEAILELAIIDMFRKLNYDYVLGEKVHRKFTDILLEDDMRSYHAVHYPDLAPGETATIIW